MLDNTPNQPTKFRIKNWVEINDESHGMYNTNIQIKFKTSTLKSRLRDHVYVILVMFTYLQVELYQLLEQGQIMQQKD